MSQLQFLLCVTFIGRFKKVLYMIQYLVAFFPLIY